MERKTGSERGGEKEGTIAREFKSESKREGNSQQRDCSSTHFLRKHLSEAPNRTVQSSLPLILS